MTAPTSPAAYCRRYGHDFTDTGRRRPIADEGTCSVCGRHICAVCDGPFTDDEWEDRHWTGPDLNDVHPACCPCGAVGGRPDRQENPT